MEIAYANRRKITRPCYILDNRERNNDKNEREREREREKRGEFRKKKIDRENWIYKELAMRNTLFARAERKRRGIRETKDGGGRTSDRLGANNCTPLAISCITR